VDNHFLIWRGKSMSDVIAIGPFLFRTNWLVWLLSGISGYVFLHFLLNERKEYRDKIEALLSNALLYYLVIWKISPALFHPSLFLNNPLSILYLPSGNKGVLLGIIVASISVFIGAYRAKIPIYVLTNLLIAFYAMAGFVYYLFQRQYGVPISQDSWHLGLTHHPIHLYKLLLFFLLIVWVLLRKKPINFPGHTYFFLILFSTGQLLISFFAGQHSYFFGLSKLQVWSISMLMFGVVGKVLLWKKERN
jgi:hypothetical protein